MDTFGERLLHALTTTKKTRKWLADRLGVDVASVNLVIGNHSKSMTAMNAARAARALGVDFYWLCTGEGRMELDHDGTWRDVARNLANAMDSAERGQRYAQFVLKVDEVVERAQLERTADEVGAVSELPPMPDAPIKVSKVTQKGSPVAQQAFARRVATVVLDEAHRSAGATLRGGKAKAK